MESKIEKIEGAYDIPILKDKLNRVIDYLNSQDQEEICTHDFDLNNRCTKCGVRGVKDMIAELQDTPEEKEEWEKRFIRRFGYWGEEIKFIKQLLDERKREVLEEAKKIIDEESIYSGGECGTPLELLEWFVDTGLDKLNKEENEEKN